MHLGSILLLAGAGAGVVSAASCPRKNSTSTASRGSTVAPSASFPSATSPVPPVQALPVTNTTTKDWYIPACGSTFLYSINEASVPVSNVKSQSGFAIDADVYGVDLFNTEPETIKGYHDAGKKVVCYFSAGSFEDGRPDGDRFDTACYCNKGSSCAMDGWPEWWLDLHSPSCISNVQGIMTDRIKLAKERGCDAVDPDNVDSYANKPGWATTETDQLDYLLFLSKAAHDAKLGITLKNAGDMITAHKDVIVDAFDMSVIEQCEHYNECDKYQPFVDAEKAAFQIEYESGIKCTRPGFALAAYSQDSLSYELITDMCSLPCGVTSRSLPTTSVEKKSLPTGGAVQLSVGFITMALMAAFAVIAV